MSLSNKSFSVGDRVIHVTHGKGAIVEDVSNQFAEVYKVQYQNGLIINSSAGLLVLVLDKDLNEQKEERQMEKVKLPKKVAEDLEFVQQRIINKSYLFNKVFEEVSESTIVNFDDLPNDYKQSIDIRINELYKFMIEKPETYYSALINGYEIELTPEEKVYQAYKNLEEGGLTSPFPDQRKDFHLICQGIKIAIDTLGLKIKGINE